MGSIGETLTVGERIFRIQKKERSPRIVLMTGVFNSVNGVDSPVFQINSLPVPNVEQSFQGQGHTSQSIMNVRNANETSTN
jgi:hypothetical protein